MTKTIDELRLAVAIQERSIATTLGTALGYVIDGELVIGEHTAETLADEAAEKIKAIADAAADLRTRLAALEGKWRERVVECEQEACGHDHLDVARLWLTKADAYREAADALKAELEKSE